MKAKGTMDKHSKKGPLSLFWPGQVAITVQSKFLMFCRKKIFGEHWVNNMFGFTVVVSDMGSRSSICLQNSYKL